MLRMLACPVLAVFLFVSGLASQKAEAFFFFNFSLQRQVVVAQPVVVQRQVVVSQPVVRKQVVVSRPVVRRSVVVQNPVVLRQAVIGSNVLVTDQLNTGFVVVQPFPVSSVVVID